MAFILNIDTAIESASIALAKDGKLITLSTFAEQKGQADWLHQEIKNLVEQIGEDLQALDAIGVSIGPGSYTGLRVGLSTAKGLCFALGIPLIAINTLEAMASGINEPAIDFICSLIEARRMEVFAAAYDASFNRVLKPTAMIVDKNSFDFLLSKGKVVFTGNGSKKFEEIASNSNASFSSHLFSAADMINISEDRFNKKEFSDLAYIEPFYLKDFFTGVKG